MGSASGCRIDAEALCNRRRPDGGVKSAGVGGGRHTASDSVIAKSKPGICLIPRGCVQGEGSPWCASWEFNLTCGRYKRGEMAGWCKVSPTLQSPCHHKACFELVYHHHASTVQGVFCKIACSGMPREHDDGVAGNTRKTGEMSTSFLSQGELLLCGKIRVVQSYFQNWVKYNTGFTYLAFK